MAEIPAVKPGKPRPTWGCGGCSTRWGGLKTAHCSVCHRTFSVPSNFDRHRKRGQCIPPRSVGLVRNRFGYWGLPGREEE